MRKLKKFGVALLSGACILSLAAGVAACGDSGNNETPTVVEPGTSSTLVTNKSPDQLTPENAIFAFLQKQSELQSYVITSEGTNRISTTLHIRTATNISTRPIRTPCSSR